jgi:hypothetical protein
MTPLREAEVKKESPKYYVPHHGLLKETASTNIFRVLFNASENSSNGVSVNGILMISPRVQDDLLDIVQQLPLFRIII